MMIVYKCNGKNPECCGAYGCGVNSDNPFAFCERTTRKDCAVHGACENPWDHPERFAKRQSGGRTIFEEI